MPLGEYNFLLSLNPGAQATAGYVLKSRLFYPRMLYTPRSTSAHTILLCLVTDSLTVLEMSEDFVVTW